ncbi:geranylgeranyl transferase type-1 subunit beta [Coemansia sp. RSA 2559]|nr:geranylgeranyl transferase type-1 subunit beta [Coemansia sp. RSA 2559]KAJ2869118.1 geranylgeranyl transferase type-1 subunit beta [Coemansia erecta]
MAPTLLVDKHARYFKHCLTMLPAETVSLDATRMTLTHICLAGLAALGRLDEMVPDDKRGEIIEWIYAQQIPAAPGNAAYRGFRGGSLFGPHGTCENVAANSGNVAATYSALCALLLLGDDLSRVDRKAIVYVLRQLQQPSGSFAPHPGTTERDPRFIFCACATSYILGDWSGIDRDAATRYIKSCINFDGGMTQAPFQESHGGHLYCCVASLSLMGTLDAALPDRSRTLRWAMLHQNGGYQGRTNKAPDTCYSFWIGASVEMLGGHALLNTDEVAGFIHECETAYGGVSKVPGARPDPLHSALGIAGYGFCRPSELPRMSPELLLPESVVQGLRSRCAGK